MQEDLQDGLGLPRQLQRLPYTRREVQNNPQQIWTTGSNHAAHRGDRQMPQEQLLHMRKIADPVLSLMFHLLSPRYHLIERNAFRPVLTIFYINLLYLSTKPNRPDSTCFILNNSELWHPRQLRGAKMQQYCVFIGISHEAETIKRKKLNIFSSGISKKTDRPAGQSLSQFYGFLVQPSVRKR